MEKDTLLPRLNHHIVFASAQTIPNILGSCLPNVSPSHIHIVKTKEMNSKSSVLRETLEAYKRYKISEYSLEDNVHQENIYEVLDAIYSSCGGDSLGVNLTGGTKLMALAASEWAYSNEIPAFYIDTQREQIIQIGKTWSYTPLPDVLDVRSILMANGYTVESMKREPVPENRRNVITQMLEVVLGKKGERALGRLNYVAEKGMIVLDEERREEKYAKLLSLCQEAGMLRDENRIVSFPDEDARRWCNGIWFEEYVQMVLYRMKAKKQIQSWATSVQVRKDGVLNELDALFSVRNRLYTIECKTSSLSQSEKTPPILYKADSLHDRLGGVFAKAMLCSVRSPAQNDLNRAQSMGIEVVWGEKVKQLESRLLKWVGGNV